MFYVLNTGLYLAPFFFLSPLAPGVPSLTLSLSPLSFLCCFSRNRVVPRVFLRVADGHPSPLAKILPPHLAATPPRPSARRRQLARTEAVHPGESFVTAAMHTACFCFVLFASRTSATAWQGFLPNVETCSSVRALVSLSLVNSACRQPTFDVWYTLCIFCFCFNLLKTTT